MFSVYSLLGDLKLIFTFLFIDRCMATRRDNPDGSLWRLAVDGFNNILVDDVIKVTVDSSDLTFPRTARIRVWKEVADVYEIFLVSHCGRALPSSALSVAVLKADESLEMNVLDILGDKILKSQIDAPIDVIPLHLIFSGFLLLCLYIMLFSRPRKK